MGTQNRSAIATLVERSTRYLLLVHMPGINRAEDLRDGLITAFNQLRPALRTSVRGSHKQRQVLAIRLSQAHTRPLRLQTATHVRGEVGRRLRLPNHTRDLRARRSAASSAYRCLIVSSVRRVSF
jgi:hypothetical protein